MKKLSILFCFVILVLVVRAQENDQYHNWNFAYGRSGTPGDFLRAGLEYALGEKTTLNTDLTFEISHVKDLRYRQIGLGASYRYYVVGNTLMTSKSRTNIALGIGGVIQAEFEPTIYKSLKFSERLNYGLNLQLMGEYFFDPIVGFFLQVDQRVMSKKSLGNYNYFIGVGVKIHFGNQ